MTPFEHISTAFDAVMAGTSPAMTARILVDLLRYGAASAIALIVDAGALLLLVSFGMNYLIAATIGFLSGLAAVYALSVRYVFEGRRALRPSYEAAGFLVTGLIGLVLTQASMALLVGGCDLPVGAAKIPTLALVFLFNFFSRRMLLFSSAAGRPMTSLAAFFTTSHVGRLAKIHLPLWAVILLALAAAQAMLAPHSLELLNTRAFFDTDDAMRAVQVRDLIAGQAWFDMTAYRLDSPHGVFSHWSRIVDAPLAGLELLLRLFLSPPAAELGARFLFPLLLLAALFSLSPWFARALDAEADPALAVLLALLSGALFTQFLPGRIDHHAPQIVLLMAAAGCFLRGLEAAEARWMAGAGVAMALSMAISLENLPFFAVMLLALPLLFVIDGERMRAPLGWFAASSAVGFPAAYAATIAPSRYGLTACDAYSTPHFASIVAGVAGLAALATLAPRLRSVTSRALAVVVVGVAVGATFLKIAPQCVGDPLGGVDPLLRELWLSHVTEALPLWKSWTKAPAAVIATAVPVFLALLAALGRVANARGLARRRWAVALGLIAMGFALGFFWQVRIFTSVTPLAMAPLIGVAFRVSRRLGAGFMPLTRALIAVAACILMSPVGLAALLPTPAGATAESAEKNERACLKPEALAPLKSLRPGRVAASFDFGPYVLAYTPHSVFAGPYHRDNAGNRLVIDAFLADPRQAEGMLRDAGATLVLWCAYEPAGFAARAADGLGAGLSRGDAPKWLERLPQSTEFLAVYAVKR